MDLMKLVAWQKDFCRPGGEWAAAQAAPA